MASSDTAFSMALRTAIARSGLSLDRLQARLQANGIPVSVTALSYWQSGKRQPERQSSLSAVRVLEDVLGLRPGELLSLLPPPRPRGVARRRTEPVNFPVDALRALLERVGAPHALEQQHQLNLASLHDRCEIAADGGQRSTTARAVFQSTADGQDRWLLVYDHGGAAPPRLHALRNCRAGRVEVDPEHGLTAAELIFDRSIDRGETQLIEYTLTNGGPPYPECANTHYREFRRPVREYLLEIQFDTAPARCWQYARTGDAEEGRDLQLDATGGVHAVALDFGPGVFGIGWG
ncbi:hypothetical protein GCM10017788_42540 [Amycolatopsis acidiphila]|uniref:Uncharacterized protein n=2 Tax=Amycolatopsis acidiphila TaxID=715473 RepID=A0A557ZYE1_9PSEU|nr:hypothetical protein FNH06_33035 [Amycolatopsis acidiphila]GHG76785.1 hypothetical protein GCM10017788_42540 [Amycolatopsis acidiphila]